MTIKQFIEQVDKRLDQKCSWGKNEVKGLLRDVAIQLYEEHDDTNVTGTSKEGAIEAENVSLDVRKQHLVERNP